MSYSFFANRPTNEDCTPCGNASCVSTAGFAGFLRVRGAASPAIAAVGGAGRSRHARGAGGRVRVRRGERHQPGRLVGTRQRGNRVGHDLVDRRQVRRRVVVRRHQLVGDDCRFGLARFDHRHDAGSLGQADDNQQRMARRDLQGHRRLLPGSDLGRQQPPGRRRDDRLVDPERLWHGANNGQCLDPPGADFRRHQPGAVRQRCASRQLGAQRHDSHFCQPGANWRRQPVRPAVHRPDRRSPHL